MPFEQLKSKIAKNTEYNPPDMSLFWDAIANIEKAVPELMLKRGMMGNTKRAARILWFRELTGRDIISSKQLWAAEWWLIHAWFTGIDGDSDDQGLNEIHNLEKLYTWWIDNQKAIHELAQQIKLAKKFERKAKRQAKKQDNVVPF